MKSVKTISDRLLTEVDRQRKYLGRLPKDFEFPLFNSKQALESQRRNGYRNTAAAGREIVDNAIEAGASQIHVIFERPPRLKSHERADSVSAVAFIDDASGMLPEMVRFALSWGGGTHFDDPNFIGRFGFGLPNASINQTRRVEVYTRVAKDEPWTKAWLDVSSVPDHGVQTIDEPVEAELPPFVKRYLSTNGIELDHGTVVVWDKPDRLTYRMAASLKEHLVDDFGVVYRYLLRDDANQKSIDLRVEGVRVEPVDPLFLDPRARYHVPEDTGGAVRVSEKEIPVRYFREPDTGGVHARRITDEDKLDPKDPNLLAVGTLVVTVARFPVGFAADKGRRKGEATDANRRFEVRKSRRGMSFVRANREIETVDVFPRSMRDTASGLGHWPLLQGYAYHWGVEVRFEPSLDEIFGITNDKQTVRPIEDFWRILAEEEIDAALHRENAWQEQHRAKAKPRATPSNQPSPAERAASTADSVAGRRPHVPDSRKEEANEALESAAEKRAEVTQESIDEALAALQKEAKARPYRIDYFDDPDGPFYEPMWEGLQIVVRVNRKHPFYETLYGELLQLGGGTKAKEAVDVVLIALSKGELTVDDDLAKLWYESQRKETWSPFLAKALRVLAQTLRPDDEIVDGIADAGGGQPFVGNA